MASEPKSRRLPLLGLLALFGLSSLIILPLPFLRDQSIYAYLAWAWVNDRIPFRDAFEHKGPLLYAVYAAALSFSKGAMWGVNLADVLARASAVLLTFWAARIILEKRFAFTAALFAALPLFAVFNSCWWNAEAETFMLPLLPLSLGLALGPGHPRRFLAGLVAAQTVALKPTALLHALFLFFPARLSSPQAASARPAGKSAGLSYGAGLLAGIIPWLLYFASKGALADLYSDLIRFNTFHAGLAPGQGFSPALAMAGKGAWTVFGLLMLPAAAGVLDRRRLLLLGWTAQALAQVALQGKFFLYHWLVVIPPLALLAAGGMRWIFDNLRRPLYHLAWAAFLLQAALGLSFYALLQNHYQSPQYLLGTVDRDQYYSRFREPGTDFNFYATWHAADYLRHHTAAGDTVLVFGYEPGINYLAGRFAPTRFHSDYPLTFTPASAGARQWREQARRIFMHELMQAPPRMILLVSGDQNALEPEDSLTQARSYPQFWEFLTHNYQSSVTIEDFHFYERHAHRRSD